MLRSINIKSLSVAVSTLILSTSVNAVVLNTLNGVDYQWLELTETQGLSRAEVEARLADTNDALYGYEYASFQQVEELFLSYATWDGLDGYHGDASVILGVSLFMNDFGATDSNPGNGVDTTVSTVDGGDIQIDGWEDINAFYGTSGENVNGRTRLAQISLRYDSTGVASGVWQSTGLGWDADTLDASNVSIDSTDPAWGSLLVQTTAVPVPAAVWLFGSGLLGLVGIARRKKHSN